MANKTVRYDFNPDIRFPAYLTRKRLLEGVSKHAPVLKGKLLDFGCGSKPYRSLFKVDQYIGLDISDNPGHSHDGEDIDVFYDGKKIPFEDNYFDSVFSSEVFEHVFNLDEMLIEINRVMKLDGKILITCPFAICEHEQPHDYARYTSFAIKHLFEKNGFEIIEYNKVGNSVEVVFQLWLMYVHINISPLFKNIPIIRSAFRLFTYLSLNSIALMLGRILPDRGNLLYLNNVVLCKKIKNLYTSV